jgi:hypothetical protein
VIFFLHLYLITLAPERIAKIVPDFEDSKRPEPGSPEGEEKPGRAEQGSNLLKCFL